MVITMGFICTLWALQRIEDILKNIEKKLR